MAGDFGGKQGSFQPGTAQENGTPKTSGKPSTGFDNSSRGQKEDAGPGPGFGKNPRKIS
jgi:hypothetical protein